MSKHPEYEYLELITPKLLIIDQIRGNERAILKAAKETAK